jgi:tRNA threonylcarbamoyladenosine biosynthesis protein TsaB
MLSLNDLVRDHAPLLVLDTASLRIQVGVFGPDGSSRWAAETGEAGTAVFRCIDQLDVDLSAIRAFAFCEGPGSILGIRTAAMAIRAWNTLAPRPVFSFGSLDLVARSLGKPETRIIADARRDSWHCQVLNLPLRRVGPAELSGDLVTPDFFRSWSSLPAGTITIPYDVEAMIARTAPNLLFKAAPEPDAFLHEEPAYATWQPHVHRAPTL